MRRGAVAPDIGSVDALKAALMAAKSVMYSKTGISGVYMPKMLEKLGIATQIAPKAENPSQGTVGEALARGEAEIALQQISELLPVPGIKVVGPLPAEVQLVTVFSAGIFAAAAEPRAARMLVEAAHHQRRAVGLYVKGARARILTTRHWRLLAPATTLLPTRMNAGRRRCSRGRRCSRLPEPWAR